MMMYAGSLLTLKKRTNENSKISIRMLIAPLLVLL